MTESLQVASTDPRSGLSAAEVADRFARGLDNDVPPTPSRTVAQILAGNIFTRFNLLMTVLLLIVLACGAFKDALFGGVILANALVGIVQELRAKRTLDSLSLLSSPKAIVVRDSEIAEISIDELVLDDIVELVPGHQVVADAIVVETTNLEVDESMLTGESDPVVKVDGDRLFSGSFVVAGSGRAQVDKVGSAAYATRLAQEAKQFTLAKSELRASVDKIIAWVTWAIIPTGAVLLWSSLRGDHRGLRESLVVTTGGVVAMVPEGLILLTTVAFAVGVVRLARRRTLVQELPAIEILARVDVVCLDKTGTITTGKMNVATIQHVPGGPYESTVLEALGAIAWSEVNPNATQLALQQEFTESPPGWSIGASVPFSSARKWSSTSFVDRGSWVLGAPELVLEGDAYETIRGVVDSEASQGRRVIVIAFSKDEISTEVLPAQLVPAGLVMIEDEIRPDAPETLSYFAAEDVDLKVISGDNPVTVGAVATRAQLPGSGELIDARHLPEGEPEFSDAVERVQVFGRVTPHQKRNMVGALQGRGHTVAMTGDGVNDVLALKDADVGIAMASGSEAARAVAQLVLLDSNFSGLPQVVAEGRKVINNLQRVASLFLTKTTYAILIALVSGLMNSPYPFLPRHLTLVGTLTIGIPSFFLAFAPNTERLHGAFFRRVARVSIPSGIVASALTLIAFQWADRRTDFSFEQAQTTAALVLSAVGMLVLIRTSRPLAGWKLALIASMGVLVMLAIVTPLGRRFFELKLPPAQGLWVVIGLAGIAALLMMAAESLLNHTVGRD